MAGFIQGDRPEAGAELAMTGWKLARLFLGVALASQLRVCGAGGMFGIGLQEDVGADAMQEVVGPTFSRLLGKSQRLVDPRQGAVRIRQLRTRRAGLGKTAQATCFTGRRFGVDPCIQGRRPMIITNGSALDARLEAARGRA
jgi:hypothetical protein